MTPSILTYQKICVKKQKVLVIGYYDRGNCGDEAYKTAIPLILGEKDFDYTFVCSDDIEEIPSSTDIVICGGGDICNQYFMTRIQRLVKHYTEPLYALSVGIPYSDGLKYLNLFDHVFIRSKTDYQSAGEKIGFANVSCIPDVTLSLRSPVAREHTTETKKIGVCLATPMFCNNIHKDSLINSIESVLQKLLQKNMRIYLLSFNTYVHNGDENDFLLNTEIYEKLVEFSSNIFLVAQQTPIDMLHFIGGVDMTICMRYHSAEFSFIQGVPSVILNISSKMNKFVVDNSYEKYALSCKKDKDDKPVSIDDDLLYDIVTARLNDTTRVNPTESYDYSDVKNLILNKKLKRMIVKKTNETREIVHDTTKRVLTNYLNISNQEYDIILTRTGKFDGRNHCNLNLARVITFTVTSEIASSYIWGLSTNMANDDFNLRDAINIIYDSYNKTGVVNGDKDERYYPLITSKRKAFVDLDFVFQNDFKDFHYAGWNYVIQGLMNFDAKSNGREAKLMVDTYVDRSFHWGMSSLKIIGIIPYKNPWVGFVHHTFDRSCSNNCYKLFRKCVFLESLKTCKALIALTKYLGRQLKTNLVSRGFNDVQVHVLTHPTTTDSKKFSFDAFLENPDKKVVQVGAWLRNPYAIYSLPLTPNYKNPLKIRKAALRGKEMQNYFKTDDLIENIHSNLADGVIKAFGLHLPDHPISRNHHISRDHPPSRDPWRPSRDPWIPSRDPWRPSRDPISRDILIPSRNSISPIDAGTFSNKYNEGLFKLVVENDESVEVLSRVDNDGYDDLFSKNIIFLNLIDASACNSVLECTVRNTPLIVNRHPAVQEVLGDSYPGFYETTREAADILGDVERLRQIHEYLRHIDKKQFSLSYFLEKFQEIVAKL